MPAQLRITPDGHRYLAMAQGAKLPTPFSLRWLLPRFCSISRRRWLVVNRASFVVLAASMAWLVHGYGPAKMAAAAILLLSLPGIRFGWRCPILVDTPGMALALAAAAIGSVGGVGMAMLGAGVRETVPAFAWAMGSNPWLLLGVVPVTIARFVRGDGDDVLDAENAWIIRHPFAASRKYHRNVRWTAYVAPWGVCLLAVAHPTLPMLLCLLLAYGQVLMATDTVRLYQWAAPAVIVSWVAFLPWWLALPLAVANWFNPWRGNGI